MKKLLFIAAVACVALAGCAKNETLAPTMDPGNSKISFAAPLVAPATKALVEKGEAYPTTEKFIVSAVWTSGNYATWGAGTVYMDEVVVGHDGGSPGSWDAGHGAASANDYYWPKDGNLTFQAVSPSTLSDIAFAGTGVTITGHTVDDNAVDVMFSERSYNRTSSTNNYSGSESNTYKGVDIVFKHALASIKFTAQRADAYTGTIIKITSIELQNVNKTGTFEQGMTDGAAAVTPTDLYHWTALSNKGNMADVVTTDYSVENTTATSFTTNDLVAIPQKFLDDTQIVINYTINGVPQDFTAKLKDYNYTGLGSSDKGFEVGKQYTFNIKIALDKIYFAPVVTSWANVTVTDLVNN